MTASTYDEPFSSIFEFVPQRDQDTALLQQVGFLPGLKELLMLRQVHALEHATVWVLSERARSSQDGDRGDRPEQLSGLSTDQGFYLYGYVHPFALRRAVYAALRRLTDGEWYLAVHPRCGTNTSVNLVLTASLALGLHLLLPRGPLEQLFGLGIAASAAAQISPDLGSLVQQHITTAIPFNLALEAIQPLPSQHGQTGHFVKVRWIEHPQN